MIHNQESFDLLFEVSWEVCNKVGGIYTVLSTKANTLQKQHKDKTIFIGPDVWTEETPSPYFVESKSLLKEWRNSNQLPKDVKIRVGRWNIPGKPIVILVDYKSLYQYKNQLYSQMWESFKVDSLHAYGDYDESCMFAYGAALVIESYYKYYNKLSDNVIAHFDEWTTGMGLLYVKANMPHIATVFTTHATSIGRSICGNNKPLYDYMRGYFGYQMAQQLNMQSKHSLEKAAAQNADAFTTVSDVTAVECEQLLECRPTVVTPNGFEANFVPAKSKYKEARQNARETLLKVASNLLGNQVADDSFLLLTSGRNEFRNKGLDVFIDSVNTIRHNSSKRNIIAFIMVPAWVAGPRADLIEQIDLNQNNGVSNNIITHNLHEYNSDSIYNKINYLGLHNYPNENVKIIYVPSYLNGDDGIFNKSYYELLPGFDATAFASYYEPWGYTPLESIAFGIPTITTDLSGFGQWMLSNFENDFLKSGVKVLHRTDSNYSNLVAELSSAILYLAELNSNDIELTNKSATKTAKEASWKNFIDHYYIAYATAISNVAKR